MIQAALRVESLLVLMCTCVCSFQVDSKGEVNQFLPKHSHTMLENLNRQRLNNQFCDITLLIEGEEHHAHRAVLAACSEYFHELFFEKGAASTHEAVVDLSGEFLSFLCSECFCAAVRFSPSFVSLQVSAKPPSSLCWILPTPPC